MNSNLPKKGEFFELRPDARRRGKGHGVVFENESSLKTPPNFLLRPDQGGFPPLRETPRLVYYPSEGWPPEDLEAGMSGYWLVSGRLREVMAAVDPGAFAFRRLTIDSLMEQWVALISFAMSSEPLMPWMRQHPS